MTAAELQEIRDELDKPYNGDEHWMARNALPRVLAMIDGLVRDGVIVLLESDDDH